MHVFFRNTTMYTLNQTYVLRRQRRQQKSAWRGRHAQLFSLGRYAKRQTLYLPVKVLIKSVSAFM